jgi:hypothetical protein
MSRRTAAGLLLAAGAALVVIAAAAFAAADWGSIRPAGRVMILAALAALALAAPWPLVRRGLRATGESAAAVGLPLTIAVTFLAQHLAGHGLAGGLRPAAADCAILAAGWALYGVAAPVRGPRLAAVVLAQFPVPLAAAATGHGLTAVALGLLATSGADLVLAGRRRLRAVRLSCCVTACASWAAGLLLVCVLAVAGHQAAAESFWLSGGFLLAALIAFAGVPVTGGRLRPGPATAVSGALTAVGLALPATAVLPGGWVPGAFAVAGTAVTVTAWQCERRRRGPSGAAGDLDQGLLWPRSLAVHLAAGGTAVLGAAGLWVTPGGLASLASLAPPLSGLRHPWTGPSVFARPAVPVTAGQAWTAAPAIAGHVWTATPAVLGLAALACWWLGPVWSRARPAAVAIAALAAGSLAVAAGLPGRAGLITLTVATAVLLAVGSKASGRMLAGMACAAGLVLACCAALWSLTSPAATIAALAALAACTVAAAAAARHLLPVVLATAGAVAAVTGLAWVLPLASGSASAAAAFAVLGVAVAAVGAATLLRGLPAAHALVLELSAGPVAVLAAVLAGHTTSTFSLLAVTAALLAAGASWLSGGLRRAVALDGAAVAAVAALIPQSRLLALAVSAPYRQLSGLWRGPAAAAEATTRWPGLPLAAVVLAGCAAMAVIAAGACRGSRGSLDILAVALPAVVAAAAAAGGLSYGPTVGVLLALTVILAGWAAASRGLAPSGAALMAILLTAGWALAAPLPTLVVAGCLCAACAACSWRARLAEVRVAAAALAVLSGSALAAFAALAAGLPAWLAGMAALAAAALAQLAAFRLARVRPAISLVAEVTGWIVAAAAVMPALASPAHASPAQAGIALAAAGLLCLAVALRADRRAWLWAGLALGEAVLCIWLAAAGVHGPEPYCVPAAAVLIAAGWHHGRGRPQAGSWVSYGPGLTVLLLPSLAAAWPDHGWARPLLLGLAAAAVTVAGGRARLRAPLLLGALVAIVDAGHQVAPAVGRLAVLMPRWFPIAVTGVILLAVGATYESRLRDLTRLRSAYARLG